MRSRQSLCLVFFATVIPVAALADEKERITFPEARAVVQPSELDQLKLDALKGSAEAAHRLATFYGTVKLDNRQRIYWTQIRVENGDADARYDLGAFLAVEPDKASHIRARYWLESVSKRGPSNLVDLANGVLKDLDKADAQKLFGTLNKK